MIAHIPSDMITYEESTIPLELNKPRVEPSTIRILCVHHSNNNVGNIEQINALNTIFNNLQIPLVHTHLNNALVAISFQKKPLNICLMLKKNLFQETNGIVPMLLLTFLTCWLHFNEIGDSTLVRSIFDGVVYRGRLVIIVLTRRGIGSFVPLILYLVSITS